MQNKISKQNKIRNQSKFDVISNLFIIIFCILSLFPIYWLFTGSFKFSSDIVKIPPDWFPVKWNLTNYANVFLKNPAGRWIFNSVFITLVTAIGIILVSSAAGYALSKMNFVGKNLILAFVIAGLLIPMEIYLLPLYNLIVNLGWKGSYFGFVIPNLTMPFGVYLMKNFYDNIPNEVIEATEIDGCNKVHFFFKFGIPLSKPGIGALAILSSIRIWNNYLWQLLNSTSEAKSYTLPVGVAKMFDVTGGDIDYGLKFAAAALSALPLLVIFFAFQRFFTAGISSGAVKG
jgi:multiple sugar transport system permease protein